MTAITSIIILMFFVIAYILHHHNRKIQYLHIEIQNLQDTINSTNSNIRDIHKKMGQMQKDIEYLKGKIHSLCDDD